MGDDDLVLERLLAETMELRGQATTHSSAGKENYERLEFLGNAVLNLALADLLFHRFRERGERALSEMCNYLRSDDILNEVGRRIGLDKSIRYEPKREDGPVDSIVAGSLEAIIGAVFEKNGYYVASESVAELFLTEDLMENAQGFHHPISELKELVDKKGCKERIRQESFLDEIDGKPAFYHIIEFEEKTAIGVGFSKKKAEADASQGMLALINDEP